MSLITEYPRVADPDTWEKFLERNLRIDEKIQLIEVVMERQLNSDLKLLQENILSYGPLYVPSLTKCVGNCLFESLSILGLGDENEIRKNVAAVMLLMRSERYFFPSIENNMEELFSFQNYESWVYSRNEKEMYEYNYDMMILDLYQKYSWTRLPTELILLAISRIYEIKILIYHNKSIYVNEINAWTKEDEPIETIRLGHLNEDHYIPIAEIPLEIQVNQDLFAELISIPPKYVKAKNRFHKWARKQLEELNQRLMRRQNNEENNQENNQENNFSETDELTLEDFLKME